jgi:hypothetical protein
MRNIDADIDGTTDVRVGYPGRLLDVMGFARNVLAASRRRQLRDGRSRDQVTAERKRGFDRQG